jgi:hypothetical protein
VARRERGRDRPAGRVAAEHRVADAEPAQRGGEQVGLLGHLVAVPRRLRSAVAEPVEADDPPLAPQRRRLRRPPAHRARRAVQQHDRRAAGVARPLVDDAQVAAGEADDPPTVGLGRPRVPGHQPGVQDEQRREDGERDQRDLEPAAHGAIMLARRRCGPSVQPAHGAATSG